MGNEASMVGEPICDLRLGSEHRRRVRKLKTKVGSPGRPVFNPDPVAVLPGTLCRSPALSEHHFPICKLECAWKGWALE